MTGLHEMDTLDRDDAELDRRIGAALRAAAAQVDDETLRAALAPRAGSLPVRGHLQWTAPLLAAAAVVSVITGTVAVTSSMSGQPHRVPVGSNPGVSLGSEAPGSARVTESASVPTGSERTALATDAPSGASGSSSQAPPSAHCPFADLACPQQSASYYASLWPFADYDEVQRWRAQVATGAAATWHADAVSTARNYLHDVLGFTDLDVIKPVAPSVDSADADVQVGYRDGAGLVHVAATLHLVRYGWQADGTDTASPAPWEVVGTEPDPSLVITTPADNSLQHSPLAVAGTVSAAGQGSTLVVAVRDRAGQLLGAAPASVAASVAASGAGAQASAWTASVTYRAGTGQPIAVVASVSSPDVQHRRFGIAACYG